MKQEKFIVRKNRELSPGIFEMVLEGNTEEIRVPGQFVNIEVPDKFLRRPISVCDRNGDTLTLIYKVVGGGTEIMAGFEEGFTCDLLTGLGNGYDTEKSGDKPLLIGGGVGIPPLYGLLKALVKEGKHPSVILGFNSKDEIFYEEEFRKLLEGTGGELHIVTVDGSYGEKGFVTDPMKHIDYTYFYTCGPMAMFRAMIGCAETSGQFSLEERMGCGFGACMGCSIKTRNGVKRVCKEGPVFEREEILW